ncbi:MAG: hypothetical protein Q4B81_08430, partial [Moraxella sp.]|nr:hypothetical protein [Moraxella sp.]
QLSSQIRQPNGQYATATALDSLTTKVGQVDGKITAEANKVSQLQTTLNGQTTSIRNVEQSVNGVRATKVVTVDNNGFLSGYGLVSELQNGQVTSRFGINADQIYFGATTSAKKPFIFNTRPAVVDGVSYPAGAWLNSASIANASITNAHIANGSIDNAKIVDGAIDTAKIRDGVITTAKIGTAQVDTLQIAGEAVVVPRAVSTGFKEWQKTNINEQVFAATLNSHQAPVVIGIHAVASGTMSFHNNRDAQDASVIISLIATHVATGKKEWLIGYDVNNPPNNSVPSYYHDLPAHLSHVNLKNDPLGLALLAGVGSSHYWGRPFIAARNNLLFLPTLAGDYRFELTVSMKTDGKIARARIYEASMLLMAVKR